MCVCVCADIGEVFSEASIFFVLLSDRQTRDDAGRDGGKDAHERVTLARQTTPRKKQKQKTNFCV